MNGVELKEEAGILTARLSREIDHHSAKGMREQIDTALIIKRPRLLRLDFSGVEFMDSSGIGLIIGRAGKASDIGCEVEVTGLSETLRRLVRISGVQKLKNLRIT